MPAQARESAQQKVKSVTLKAFAKLNLTLDVLSRRPDGYHDIQSVMQTVSLHDIVTVREAPKGVLEVHTDAPHVPGGSRNLAYRAAVLVQEVSKLDSGVRMEISKSIPAEAGLGGGSSNGAAVLVAMNKLFGLGISSDRLVCMAAALGSDAPFFVMGGTVLARGRGEELVQLPDAPAMTFVLVKPDIGVPTAWAYAALDKLSDRRQGESTKRMIDALCSHDANRIASAMSNDFEQVVLPEFPAIRMAKERLLALGASTAVLAGSGAAVFGVFPNEGKALEVSDHMRAFGQTFVVRSVGRAEAQQPWL